MRHRKIVAAIVVFYLLLCAALYIFLYVIPDITGALTPTAIVQYGQMRTEKTYDAVIVRSEEVFVADKSGSVSYYVNNNTKTRKGIKILDIYSGGGASPVICPGTGEVSYFYDGYESILTPLSMSEAISALKDSEGNSVEVEVSDITKSVVSVGQPLYKLITSDEWYTVFSVPNEDVESMGFAEKLNVTLEFETGTVSAQIHSLIPKEEETVVIVSTTKYFSDFDRLRQCKVNLVLRDSKGLIVPNSAIAVVDDKPGVYVKRIDGEYIFTRIKVINSDENSSVLYADKFSELRADGLTDTIQTISIYDEILKNAEEYSSNNIE